VRERGEANLLKGRTSALSYRYHISSGYGGLTRLAGDGSVVHSCRVPQALTRQLRLFSATRPGHRGATEAIHLHQGGGKKALIWSSVGIVAGSGVTCESH
jgi:hypothetical protein